MNGRIKLLALFVLCAALCIMAAGAMAATITLGDVPDVEIVFTGYGAKITEFPKNYQGSFTVPDSVADALGTTYSITTVANNAFQGCTGLTSIDLGNVSSISHYAFQGCTSLASVTFADGASISEYAFRGCTSLTSVDLSKVSSIGGYAFDGCTSLASVTFANGASISEYAFRGCTGLTSIDLSKVSSIGIYAFGSCTNLTSVTFAAGTTIAYHAFYNCTGLTSVDLSNVSSIGNYAFEGCTGLTSVNLSNVSSIGFSPFDDCTNLKTVYIPADSDFASKLPASAEIHYSSGGCSWKSGYSHDETHHWEACTCGATRNAAEHSGGTATCKDKAVCPACGQPYGSLNSSNHSGGTEIRDQKAATEFEAGYTGDTYCLGCNNITQMGEDILATHQHFYLLKRDATGHWEECSCGVKRTHEAHIPGAPATETTPQTCTVCSYELSPIVIPTPTPKPTAKPTATPEPTATPIPDTSDLPKTGDASRPGLWMMLLLAAGACAAALRRARTN